MARASIKHVEILINSASGGVGPKAVETAEALLQASGVSGRVSAPPVADLDRILREIVAAKPDALITIAGDGTARAAAELCGDRGPLLAPLPGGTMNMLPYALYGRRHWREILEEILRDGEEEAIGLGEIDGRTFLVAAIFGAPALWAPAREAARSGQLALALRRAGRAWRRAFSQRLRLSVDGAARRKVEAAAFLCPVISRALDEGLDQMEAASFETAGAAEAFRLGLHALTGDWRKDPAVDSRPAQRAVIHAGQAIPAILDGEPVRFGRTAHVTYRPKALRILATPKEGA